MKFSTFFAFSTLLLALTVSAKAEQNSSKSSSNKQKKTIPANVEVLKDIEFAKPGGHSLRLDLYRPKQLKSKVPVVVFVHGGGWLNGSKKAGRRALFLVPHGFAVASISYRLTDKGQWPDQINDCYSSIRWLRANAQKYQLDADHIGCWGTSAGGHLAALMGTRRFEGNEKIYSRVQAVCDWFGPAELLTMPANTLSNGRTYEQISKSNGAKLLGATVREVSAIAKDASALDNVSKDDPPFLIMHGDADPGVPLIQSQKLHKKLKAVGVDSKLIILKGAGHGGPEFNSEKSKKAVIDFFTRTLKK